MKWLHINLGISAFLYSAMNVVASPSQQATENRAMAENCRPSLTMDASNSIDSQCTDYTKTYLGDAISGNKENQIMRNLDAQLETDFSAFQQRAMQTRAGSHFVRQHRSALLAACPLNDSERLDHISMIADELGYTDEARVSFINMIQTKFERGVIC